mgnify:CR=1 FL=1
MACVRWAETATWPAVLRGPMAGREQRGKPGTGSEPVLLSVHGGAVAAPLAYGEEW